MAEQSSPAAEDRRPDGQDEAGALAQEIATQEVERCHCEHAEQGVEYVKPHDRRRQAQEQAQTIDGQRTVVPCNVPVEDLTLGDALGGSEYPSVVTEEAVEVAPG